MSRVAIVDPIRTPIGKFGGALSSIPAGELGAVILRALVEPTKIDPGRVDDVVLGHGYANGEAACVARWSLLAADFPVEVPGVQLDRRCGSGPQAVIHPARRVQTGAARILISGCRERQGNVER